MTSVIWWFGSASMLNYSAALYDMIFQLPLIEQCWVVVLYLMQQMTLLLRCSIWSHGELEWKVSWGGRDTTITFALNSFLVIVSHNTHWWGSVEYVHCHSLEMALRSRVMKRYSTLMAEVMLQNVPQHLLLHMIESSTLHPKFLVLRHSWQISDTWKLPVTKIMKCPIN